MRILHTADWHFGAHLGRISLAPMILAALEALALQLEMHQVDVLVVAGDLLDARLRPEMLELARRELERLFSPFIARGGRILAVAGAHDTDDAFETVGRTLSQFKADSIVFATSPTALRLSDRDGTQVQFALFPYPTPRRYASDESRFYASLREKHQDLKRRFLERLETLRSEILDSQPSIFVGHLALEETPEAGESEVIVFAPDEVLAQWTYAACGHRHAPQSVSANTSAHYAGSLVRLAPSERDDAKSVVLLDLDAAGAIRELQLISLPVTPFYDVEINDPDTELDSLAARFPEAPRALVHYTLRYRSDTHDLVALLDAIESVFPFWYGRKIERQDGPSVASEARFEAPERVLAYLESRFKDHPDRDALLNLARRLLAEDADRIEE